jgi:hypothetical protein
MNHPNLARANNAARPGVVAPGHAFHNRKEPSIMKTAMLIGTGNEPVEFVEATPTAAEVMQEAQGLDERDQTRLLAIVQAMKAGRLDITPERAAAMTRAEIIDMADSLLN